MQALASMNYILDKLRETRWKYLIIIWLSNLSILSVPDEGYSRNALCALHLISTFLFKETIVICDRYAFFVLTFCFPTCYFSWKIYGLMLLQNSLKMMVVCMFCSSIKGKHRPRLHLCLCTDLILNTYCFNSQHICDRDNLMHQQNKDKAVVDKHEQSHICSGSMQ